MPTFCRKHLIVIVCLVLFLFPVVSLAGDSLILVIHDWGIGEIGGRIMLYTGRGTCIDTPIPAPPRGPRWDFAYGAASFAALGSLVLWLRRHRRDNLLSTPRGFEVQPVRLDRPSDVNRHAP